MGNLIWENIFKTFSSYSSETDGLFYLIIYLLFK